ncbi:MAG: hypothetical protein CM15mP64_5650 [Candidatus Neomarinimicrobiota bacterium]|nr:MAG: hypothetical protein CM15mP64_5650 [Candidatus Neomarinimicrobiota bacterium]
MRLCFKDPALGRDIRYAKKRILNPPKKPTKTPVEEKLEEANRETRRNKKITRLMTQPWSLWLLPDARDNVKYQELSRN